MHEPEHWALLFMFVGRKSSICFQLRTLESVFQNLNRSLQKLSEPSASVNWKCSCCSNSNAVPAPELGRVPDLGSTFAYGAPSPAISPDASPSTRPCLAHCCLQLAPGDGELCGIMMRLLNTQSAPTTGDAHPSENTQVTAQA